MMKIILGEILAIYIVEQSTDLDISRNEYPDEEDSDDDGSYGGYCDEDGLATGVRGFCYHFSFPSTGNH